MSANASPATALTEAEARARLARDGPNRLPSARHKTLPAAIVSAAAQPMVLLLLACTAVYALLGSAFDSAVLSVSILVVAGISVYLSLLPLLGGPLLLLPLHVVLLELIIDPACSLVFEAEPSPDDAMRQPPRPAQTALFDARAVARALTVGATALVAVAAVQWVGHRAGWPDETLRLAALTSIIVANLAMLWWFRTGFTARQHTNRIFDALLLGVSLFYGAVLLVHPLSAAFGFPTSVEPHWIGVGLAVTAGWSAWRLARGRGGRRSG